MLKPNLFLAFSTEQKKKSSLLKLATVQSPSMPTTTPENKAKQGEETQLLLHSPIIQSLFTNYIIIININIINSILFLFNHCKWN